MDSIFGWTKSTRSILAIMAMILLFVVVIGNFLGAKLPNDIISLVVMIVSGIVTAYFGKRDASEDAVIPDNTNVTSQKTETTTIQTPPKEEEVLS